MMSELGIKIIFNIYMHEVWKYLVIIEIIVLQILNTRRIRFIVGMIDTNDTTDFCNYCYLMLCIFFYSIFRTGIW